MPGALFVFGLSQRKTRPGYPRPIGQVDLSHRIIVVGKPSEELTSHEAGNIHGPYANLSCCWADSQNVLKTTSTSL
ncbi:Uncharacterized protein HZ326_18292 [Fusarium oxysporum f. sp. albedinis]|nr:Uncharacterized protein HZ326_18292 [Fusarium oxysporum f. sp. albedinis]